MSNKKDENYISDLPEKTESEAVANRKEFERNLQNMWGYSETGIEAKKAAMAMLSTKNGMYAKIPLVCKADDCPYKNSCSLLPFNLAPVGEPCPSETAQIELFYAGYDKDFDLDNSSFVDRNLVLSLINYDIMLERIKANLQNEDGMTVQEIFAGVSEQGEEFTKPEISKYLEAYERVEKKRNDIYALMLATRKDKKNEKGSGEKSITDIINSVIDSNNIDESDVIDVDSEEQ